MSSGASLQAQAARSGPASSPNHARLLLQRKCACGTPISSLTDKCARCRSTKRLQARLAIGASHDPLEQQADRVADRVMAGPAHGSVGRAPPHIQHLAGPSGAAMGIEAPASVERVLAAPGTPLPAALRKDMELRFGHDFAQVRVHCGAAAERSARDVNASAYTVGQRVVFGAGRYAPATAAGRRLLAHELTHVVQQSGAEHGIVQRAPLSEVETDYQRFVKQGTWCRDSEKSGELHPGLQCYRAIPEREGYPDAEQVCFNKATGQFAESSPDFVSAVSGQKKDGTCDIPMGITDPPQPFTQRGRRALGHLIGDIATEDPDLIGRHFGRISGVAMGIALPKHGLDPGLGSFAIPAILGYVAGELGARGLPLLNRLAQRHGFVPTISLGAGSNAGLGLGVGLEKRDRPLPVVPVNTYLTFALDSSLAVTGEPGASSTFLAKVGVRIDPGQQGGLFALGSVGAGLAAGDGAGVATSAGVGVGLRATDFLDVQLVRETVSGEGGGDATYWLTLKLVAPQRVLKGHR